MESVEGSNTGVANQRLEQMDRILDYIRTNLRNVRNTWGPSSPQYQSTVEIMQRALSENQMRLKVEDAELEELMGKMSLVDDGKR